MCFSFPYITFKQNIDLIYFGHALRLLKEIITFDFSTIISVACNLYPTKSKSSTSLKYKNILYVTSSICNTRNKTPSHWMRWKSNDEGYQVKQWCEKSLVKSQRLRSYLAYTIFVFILILQRFIQTGWLPTILSNFKQQIFFIILF